MVLVLLLAACADTTGTLPATPSPDSATSLLPYPTPSPSKRTVLSARRAAVDGGSAGVQQATRTPTPQPTPESVQVEVWWPDELYPQADSPAEAALLEQFDGFRQTAIYGLEVRRKRSGGLGGILPTLRTAEPVAPSAMPDLTLMRRSDMVIAATEELILPLAEWVPNGTLDGLLPGAQALGEVDGVLYGVPYALNFYHVVYYASVFDAPLANFEHVLDAAPRYWFPASPPPNAEVNWTLLLQYLAAGGRLVGDTGALVLDEEPLLAVLDYYAQGVDAGIFDPALLNFTGYADYWNDFVASEVNMIGVDTMTYLRHKDSVQNIGLEPVPTRDGSALTALDGWMWVVTARDPDHQKRARAFMSWMMRISQQSAYTELFGVLPSQQSALRLWENEAYVAFAQSMLPDARVIPSAQRNSSAAVVLQQSFERVLEGTSAQAAVDQALGTLVDE